MNIIYDPEKHFLGKLCRHDHDWENSGFSLRAINSKQCVICQKESLKKYYEKNRDTLLENRKKYYGENRDTLLEHSKIYREANKEHITERQRNYYQENADKFSEYRRNYYQENADKLRERSRNYNQENVGKIREFRRNHYQENASKILERNRNYRQTPSGKSVKIRNNQKRRAIKKGCHSQPYKQEDILNLFNGECAYCGNKVKLSLDHFIPLNKGGSDVQGNLLPACLSCNCSKRNFDAIDWYKSQSFFDKKRLRQILKILGKTESNYDQIPLF